jgi:hypothetical protein
MAGASSPKLRLLTEAGYRRTFYLMKRVETEAGLALDDALHDYDITRRNSRDVRTSRRSR